MHAINLQIGLEARQGARIQRTSLGPLGPRAPGAGLGRSNVVCWAKGKRSRHTFKHPTPRTPYVGDHLQKYLDEIDADSFRAYYDDDTSLPYQIALLTARITLVSDTVVGQRKNYNLKRRLQEMLHQQQKMCKDLYKQDPEIYRLVIAKLGLENVIDPVLQLKRKANIFSTTTVEERLKMSWIHHKKKSKYTPRKSHPVLERPPGTPPGVVPLLDLDWRSKIPRKDDWLAPQHRVIRELPKYGVRVNIHPPNKGKPPHITPKK